MTKVDYFCEDNKLSDSIITIGIMTKQLLHRLLNDGDIDENAKKTFYKSVRSYYADAVSQALQKLPFADNLLNHSKFLNFEQRGHCSFSSVEYFCCSYSNLLQFSPAEVDRLQEEFIDYQLLENSHIPQAVWKEAIIYEDESSTAHHRMDVIWGHMATICNADGSKRFANLFKVTQLISCIPHSNAGEERVFNLIKLNKTPTHSCLDPNGTLSSIVTVKLANEDSCFSWEPPKTLLKASKSATTKYNELHQSK